MPIDQPTRRGFLKGRTAVREPARGARVSTSPPGPPAGAPLTSTIGGAALDPQRDLLLASVRRRAMACDWEVQLSASRDDDSMEHVFAALDLVESLETQMTVYRDDSEIIRINQRASEGQVAVEPRLFALLRLAARLNRQTDGAFDITSGPLSDVWGFSRRRGRIPSDDAIAAALARVGMEQVLLDETQLTIEFCRQGASINLNGIGKGYALDRMAELLDDAGVDDYLLHGGKSSALGRGEQPGINAAAPRAGQREGSDGRDSPACSPPTGRGWSIGLRHPLRPAQRLGEFYLHGESLSTSGAGTQFFRHRGRRYGHLLDPRTGRPAEGVCSATVIAPTAAEADALSTAFYVMGPGRVAEYCQSRPELGALLVTPSEREGEIELHEFGLDEARWQRLL